MTAMSESTPNAAEDRTSTTRVVISWAIVTIPLLYGLYETLLDAAGLFTG
jgi:hypothetical protein